MSRAQTLQLTWAQTSTDLMRWDASGQCIDLTGGDISSDTGAVTIAAGTFVKAQGQQVPDSCVVTVTITAEAGVGRDAAVPLGFRVDRKGAAVLAAAGSVEGDAGGASSGTGFVGALALAGLVGGLAALRRRLH